MARRRFSQKMNEWIWFFWREKQKKPHKFVCFFFCVSSFPGKKTKFIYSFSGRIYGAPIWFWFYLTFKHSWTSEFLNLCFLNFFTFNLIVPSCTSLNFKKMLTSSKFIYICGLYEILTILIRINTPVLFDQQRFSNSKAEKIYIKVHD